MDDAEARERLTRLWLEHRDAIAAFARRRLPAEQIDDLVAETFLVAWRKIAVVPHDARPWLFGVARNIVATRLRGDGRRGALAVKVAALPLESAPAAEDVGGDRLHLARAWERLSDVDREALALVAWDGLSAAQAARVVGCRRSTFSVRLLRARRRLGRLLEDRSELVERRTDGITDTNHVPTSAVHLPRARPPRRSNG